MPKVSDGTDVCRKNIRYGPVELVSTLRVFHVSRREWAVRHDTNKLDAQLDKLEKLSSTPSKAKSKAVEEAMERLKIWQQNISPKPILEMSLGLARDVLNLHDRYEDLKPTFKTSEFCKATHEANLADFAKQKAELDQMVSGYKEAKATADKLEKQIEELQKQLAECREVQNKLGAGLSSMTKATFLVQSMVAASRPALEIAEASIH
ncbi:unnamed protein product [Prunus armeniaca]